MLKTVGRGDMFVNVWGGIIHKELKEGEKLVLDNYQLVAMSSTVTYKVTKHEGLKTTIFGGEALVLEIYGPGTVHMQTKNIRVCKGTAVLSAKKTSKQTTIQVVNLRRS